MLALVRECPTMLRAILCLCVLFLLSAERAEAGVVNCPTALKLNPSWAQSGAIGPSYATVAVGNDLVCQFAPISFESFLSFHPFGCPAKSANAAVSGGSGVWNFGSPGKFEGREFQWTRRPDLGALSAWDLLSRPGLRL